MKEGTNNDFFLHGNSGRKVVEVVMRKCVEQQAESLANKPGSGCEAMFND